MKTHGATIRFRDTVSMKHAVPKDRGNFWFLPYSGRKATIQNILFLVGNMLMRKVQCVILFLFNVADCMTL